MELDVYDFDGTIYDGDSTFDYVRFCLRRRPSLLLGLMPVALAGAKLALKKINLTQMKSVLFGQMARRIDLEEEAKLFWQDERTKAKLGAWFDKTPRDLPIVIASASPEFELRHAAALLGGVTLIGTRCEQGTGRLIGKNCKGEEKICRIGEMFGEFTVRAMYTDDTKADAPLLSIARERYLLTRGKISRLP